MSLQGCCCHHLILCCTKYQEYKVAVENLEQKQQPGIPNSSSSSRTNCSALWHKLEFFIIAYFPDTLAYFTSLCIKYEKWKMIEFSNQKRIQCNFGHILQKSSAVRINSRNISKALLKMSCKLASKHIFSVRRKNAFDFYSKCTFSLPFIDDAGHYFSSLF